MHKSVAGQNITYVRVFYLPPELPDNAVSLVLGGYGKVDRIVREKFPSGLGLDHVYAGVRGVYVDIGKEIPASLDIGSNTLESEGILRWSKGDMFLM